ncbi:hypothetical protein Ancab_034807 [Ancistrocladus abbreviatus]
MPPFQILSSVELKELFNRQPSQPSRAPSQLLCSKSATAIRFEMDGGFDSRSKTGVVKAAISRYGETFLEGTAAKNPQMVDLKEPSKARELHRARKNIRQIKENGTVAESVKAEAELELLKANKKVKDLTLRIEESNSKTKQQKQQLQKLKEARKYREERALVVEKAENHEHGEVLAEIESIKQELSKLKFHIPHALEEKSRAEKEAEASSSKMRSYLHSAEALRKKVEEANEEHVLVELARIEAVKELADIEAQRKESAAKFSSSMDETRKKKNALMKEIDHAKDLEAKLAITNSDIQMLQNELNLVKEMEQRANRSASSEHSDLRYNSSENQESTPQSQATDKELESAKDELASIRQEGFQLMASMDIIRKQRKHLSEQMTRAKKSAEKATQILNSKIVRAKDKLELASASEQQAKAILSSMSLTLDQLKTDTETAKKERELMIEETASIKTEVRKIRSQIDLAEERFTSAMQELEEVKSSEAKALEELKTLTENARKVRASAAQHSSKITISRFEYEYLSGCAAGAKEIADKKVEAAQAWIEALKVSGREILMKTEAAQKEIRELRTKEIEGIQRTENLLTIKELVDGELHNWREREDNFQAQMLPAKASPNKSMTDNGSLTPSRRARHQKSSSPVIRYATRASPITLKKRRKVMLNFSKYFARKQIEKGKGSK